MNCGRRTLLADFVAEVVLKGGFGAKSFLDRAGAMVLRQPDVGAGGTDASEPLRYKLNALLTQRTRRG